MYRDKNRMRENERKKEIRTKLIENLVYNGLATDSAKSASG